MKCKFLLMLVMVFSFHSLVFASEQSTISELENKVSQLQTKVAQLESAQTQAESDISKLQETIKNSGIAIVLFAFFCAWWAKTSGRSALLWFLLGLFFHVITAIVLLIKTKRST